MLNTLHLSIYAECRTGVFSQADLNDSPSRHAYVEELIAAANNLLRLATLNGARFGPLDVLTPSRVDQLQMWVLDQTGIARPWVLKFQASRDGFSSNQFHQKCDDTERLLVISKAVCGKPKASVQ